MAGWMLAAIVVAMSTSHAPPAPMMQAPIPIGAFSDAAHDVRLTSASGISPVDRNSIDVRRLTLSDRGDMVRFTLRIGHVLRTDRVSQLFIVDMPTPELPFAQLIVATRPLTTPPLTHDGLHHQMGIIEGTATPGGFVECHDLRISMRNARKAFWVEVPKDCMPSGMVKIRVSAQTIPGRNSDGPNEPYSRDSLLTHRSVDLGGTVVAASP